MAKKHFKDEPILRRKRLDDYETFDVDEFMKRFDALLTHYGLENHTPEDRWFALSACLISDFVPSLRGWFKTPANRPKKAGRPKGATSKREQDIAKLVEIVKARQIKNSTLSVTQAIKHARKEISAAIPLFKDLSDQTLRTYVSKAKPKPMPAVPMELAKRLGLSGSSK
jgi:hypothetical protein